MNNKNLDAIFLPTHLIENKQKRKSHNQNLNSEAQANINYFIPKTGYSSYVKFFCLLRHKYGLIRY